MAIAKRFTRTEPAPQPDTRSTAVAVVVSTSGNTCEVDIAGQHHRAAIATHIPGLQPGQRVLVQGDLADWLVTAAWPAPGAAPVFQIDVQSGLLRIHAARVQLSALGAIELNCGDASLRLSLDGKVQIEGKDVLSAASGSNRIEGASIDLN